MNYDLDMPPYIQQMADWLDDDRQVHPCNFDSAYQGFEIMMAFCRSAAQGGQVALPLASGADEIAMLEASLPPAQSAALHAGQRQGVRGLGWRSRQTCERLRSRYIELSPCWLPGG